MVTVAGLAQVPVELRRHPFNTRRPRSAPTIGARSNLASPRSVGIR